MGVTKETQRLNKYLAACGVCSRREADRLIENGQVSVDGRTAQTGWKVDGTEEIKVGGRKITGKKEPVVLAYYKPVGVTCTEKDAHAEKTIRDAVPYPERVTYAGRLDRDSEGLLLLTNDGALIQGLMRAANYHEKEYLVKVKKPVTPEFLEQMSRGVYLKELQVQTRACQVEAVGKFTFRIILTQGLNRQIRRMCKVFGYEIVSLKRVRVANIRLENLQPGAYRTVQGEELRQLYACIAKSMVGKNER